MMGIIAGTWSVAQGGVVGSKHDLSQATGGGYWAGEEAGNQVCIYCHTPHYASSTQKPLWNHTETQETFIPYSSPTFDGENYFSDPVGHQPEAESKLCLACHDGVTALNTLHYSWSGAFNMVGGLDQLGDVYYPGSPYSSDMGANIGENFPGGAGGYVVNNLDNDHPVSFTFNAALITADADGGPVQLQLPAAGDAVKLYGASADRLECSSCHDVHDDAIAPFLVKDNAGSALCLTCHIK